MRRALWVGIVFLWTATALSADRNPYLHKSEIWGKLTTTLDKVNFLLGFANGYFIGSGNLEMFECMESKVSYQQAVAMIDKYYNANPQSWDLDVRTEIISARTVKDGPCPRAAPKQPNPQPCSISVA